MARENYLWLAALIAAHPEGKVVGRTRLQKEVKLLQSLSFPTDYGYTIHFYGPYSESLYADIGLLETMGYVKEECLSHGGNPYYVIESCGEGPINDVSAFQHEIATMAAADAVVLELAATYDAFRDLGADHAEALIRLRRKKGAKCNEGREEKALKLLNDLSLPAA